MTTRRAFVTRGAACALALTPAAGFAGQYAVGGTSTTTRLDLAKTDRDRVLSGAATALARTPLPSRDAQSDAFLHWTLDLPALAAACQIDAANEDKYAAKAAELLRSWFIEARGLKIEISSYEGLLPLSALAEVAVALPFLPVPEDIAAGAKRWFKGYLGYLTINPDAGLARDARDRNGSSWLLQVAAFSRLLGDEPTLESVRVRFRHATLRAELNGDGFFRGDLSSANPFRNSLMNLDMLAGVCVLGSTRFESLWDAELQDGPGMRAAVARHAPYMAKPVTWPYPADSAHFAELPGRRPVLAFAARAYAQPEYAELFLKLKETTDPDLLRATPLRQPLLWLTAPRRRD